MSTDDWTVTEAKARFSELIDRARSKGPQTITRHGRTVAVVVSVDERRRKTRPQANLAEFLAASPLAGSGIAIKRRRDRARKLDL